MNAKNIRYNNRWKTEAIKNRIVLHLSTICYTINMSYKLNKNLFVISLELIGILAFLLCISSGMKANLFTCIKLYTPISNLKLKQMASYLIFSPFRKKIARGAYSICFYTLLQLRCLPVSLMPIKGLKEYK